MIAGEEEMRYGMRGVRRIRCSTWFDDDDDRLLPLPVAPAAAFAFFLFS